MREIVVEGKVRRVESGSYTDKNGVIVPKGTVVLAGEYDKLEIGLAWPTPSVTSIQKLKALEGHEGQSVRLLVGVESGDNRRAEPQFTFLDDLTPAPKS